MYKLSDYCWFKYRISIFKLRIYINLIYETLNFMSYQVSLSFVK